MYDYIYTCIYTRIYIVIHTYIYTYIYSHTYTYIDTPKTRTWIVGCVSDFQKVYENRLCFLHTLLRVCSLHTPLQCRAREYIYDAMHENAHILCIYPRVYIVIHTRIYIVIYTCIYPRIYRVIHTRIYIYSPKKKIINSRMHVRLSEIFFWTNVGCENMRTMPCMRIYI